MRGDAPLPPEFRWQAELTRRGYGTADAVLAPSRSFAAETAAAYGLAAPPAVVPNGRAPPAALPARTRAAPSVAFTAGRLWDEGKNVRVLDEAAGRTAIPILAAGPVQGPNGSGIALRHAQALGRLAPGEVAAHLARRPIYAAPALYEPFGLAVLEAAQHGCPMVLADMPTFRELWDGAAVFVPPRDPDGLARAIDGLARDPARAEALGEAARAAAVRFTPAAMVAGTLAVYRRVLAPAARLAS